MHFNDTGENPLMSKHNQITFEGRVVIQKRLDQKIKRCEIARELNVDPSTITSEIKRNSNGDYNCMVADAMAKARRAKSNMLKRKIYSQKLKWYVLRKLVRRWTPEDISNRLKLDFPYNKNMRISHETIYKWIFEYKKKDIHLYRFLLKKNKKSDQRGRKGRKTASNSKKPSIHDRPSEINQRKTIGHWEGDTVVGAGRTGYIASYLERKSRFYVTGKMKNATAKSFNLAIRNQFAEIENENILSFTFDQGSEMSAYEDIQEFMHCKVYFADPGSPWQKPQVENVHKLLRVFFPKKSSFKDITQEELDKVTNIINNKPRKCLGYRTPQEVFYGKLIIY